MDTTEQVIAAIYQQLDIGPRYPVPAKIVETCYGPGNMDHLTLSLWETPNPKLAGRLVAMWSEKQGRIV